MDIEISSVIEYLQRINEITSSDNKVAEEIVIRNSVFLKDIDPKKDVNKKDVNIKHIKFNEEMAKQQIIFYSNISKIRPEDKRYKYQLSKARIEGNYLRFYYRGHYKSNFDLIPSVFRDPNWDKEDYYYHEIAVRCPDRFSAYTHLEKLVLMQHYDCPTRLLDISSNPLVALYFACKNFNCPKCSKSTEGLVYVFTKPAHEVAYADSDKALMLSCLAKFSQKDKQKIVDICLRNLINKAFPQLENGRYENDEIERFYYEVTTEMPSFKREIRPLDLLNPLFVQPNKSNVRILKQDGAFILSGLSESPEFAVKKLDDLCYKKIRVKNQENIIKELERIEIHEASLFPEMDKVANYLRNR